MKGWEEEYRRKQISAEEVAALVKSGDHISFTLGREAYSVGLAIASRMAELHDVKVLQPFPGYDFGWYDPGWEDSFKLTIYMPTAISQQMVNDRRCDIEITDFFGNSESTLREADMGITEVSQPDDKGFCSFGAALWNKRQQIKRGKLVVAEVNKSLIRTFGDNYVHVSEIDYFVEHKATGAAVATGTLAGRERKPPEPYLKTIAENVSQLIKEATPSR